MQRKFSVIVPVWNAEKNIEACLTSILGQSVVPDEILLIDGKSTDNTVVLAEGMLRAQDTIVSGKDRGPYDAMNKGVALAKGEIVAILNSDDFWMPGTCERVQCIFAASDSNVGIVHGDLEYIRASDSSYLIKPAPTYMNYLCIGLPTAHPSAFVRKSVYEKVEGYDFERYPICADQDFTYRVLSNGFSLKYTPEVFSGMHAGGLSSQAVFSEEIDAILERLSQPRKTLAKALRRYLGFEDQYYTQGYKKAWRKQVALALLSFGRIKPKK